MVLKVNLGDGEEVSGRFTFYSRVWEGLVFRFGLFGFGRVYVFFIVLVLGIFV